MVFVATLFMSRTVIEILPFIYAFGVYVTANDVEQSYLSIEYDSRNSSSRKFMTSAVVYIYTTAEVMNFRELLFLLSYSIDR